MFLIIYQFLYFVNVHLSWSLLFVSIIKIPGSLLYKTHKKPADKYSWFFVGDRKKGAVLPALNAFVFIKTLPLFYLLIFLVYCIILLLFLQHSCYNTILINHFTN